MMIKIVQNHKGEGVFPNFSKGTPVKFTEQSEDEQSLHWFSCEIDGHKTYIPDCFVSNGRLNCEYNPTELICDSGEILEVLKIVYEWFVVKNSRGDVGWVPAEIAISVEVE